jgi:hypothetical protein
MEPLKIGTLRNPFARQDVNHVTHAGPSISPARELLLSKDLFLIDYPMRF